MSELREECYKCLNNRKCLGGADYGSFYCMMNRRLKMQNEDDSVYAHKFAIMQKQIDEKDKRIKELEEENKRKDMFVEMAKEVIENSILKQKVKDVLQKNRNELFSITYVGPEQYKPVDMQFDRIDKIEKELLEEK